MGHGARNNSSGSHPAREVYNSTLTITACERQPLGALDQAVSALVLLGAKPLFSEAMEQCSYAASPQHASQLLLLQ